jgi:hypothetical protein
MSRVTELAEEEALRAESEEPDDDDEGTDEPDDEELDDAEEPEARGPSDADLKRFESENTRHEKALAKIVGDDFEHFEACGVCAGVGFVPAATNVDVPFERDPQTEPCSTCNGYGTTLTGAREPGMVTRACSKCQGAGWTTVQEYPDAQPAAYFPAPSEPAPELEAPNGPPVDPAVAALRARGYIVMDPIVPVSEPA